MAPTAATRARTNKPKPEPAIIEDANAARQAAAPKKETVQQLKNRLRNEAEREVLNNHKGEVINITEAKYKEHNLEYVRRLSDEEKAAKAIEEYYRQFPNLRPQLEQQQAQAEEPEPGAHYEGPGIESDQYVDHEEEVSDQREYPSEHGQPDGNQ